MRRFFVILAVVLSFKCFSYDEYFFNLQGKFIYRDGLEYFSFEEGIIYGVGEFEQKIYIGSVEELNRWTRAYIFKVGDTVVSTHLTTFLSKGSLLDCLKKYEIYDESNQLIGFIEGVWDANAAACFLFYKEDNEFFAKASLDISSSTLTISAPDDQVLITAKKTLRTSYPREYYWKIRKETEIPFSASFLWPFVGFLSEVWWR